MRGVGRFLGVAVLIGGGAVGLAGCDSAAESGTIEVRAYGEPYVEDKIPAEAFADGWSVDFSRFLVAVSEITSTAGGEPAVADGKIHVVDLVPGSGKKGHLLVETEVPGGRYAETAFTVAPATTGAVAANVSSDDVGFMIGGGLSMYIEGTAVKDGVTKRFAWRIQTTTRYVKCATKAKVDGDTATIQLTFQADRLFYDSLVAEAPLVKFDLFASADVDQNNVITLEELAGVDITGLADYQVGSATEVTNLRAYLEALTRTLGHVDGEEPCTVE
jgi:hypothetical protein